MSEIAKSLHEAFVLLLSFNKEIYGIIFLSLLVSIASTAFAALLGVPAGVALGSGKFPGKRLIIRIIHTFMGLPPVVAGLVVYLLLSRKGPLGALQLLFTPSAMVIAQFLIVFPIVSGLTLSAIKLKTKPVYETCTGLGMSRIKSHMLLLYECRYPVISAVIAGYGRAISEVGAVMLVGGNIQHHTRVMTTAIVLETGKGNFDQALALGIILLCIAFLINWILQRFQEDV